MVVLVVSLAIPDQDRQGWAAEVLRDCRAEDAVRFLGLAIQDALVGHWRESSSAVETDKEVGQAQTPAPGHPGVRQDEVALLLL